MKKRELLKRLKNIQRVTKDALHMECDTLTALAFIVCESDVNLVGGKHIQRVKNES